jgi:hypothetical protein
MTPRTRTNRFEEDDGNKKRSNRERLDRRMEILNGLHDYADRTFVRKRL